eukprot:jgi/Botrbrau1/12033/Bobra.0293s0010.1
MMTKATKSYGLKVMPNAHNLTGYGPHPTLGAEDKPICGFGQGTGGQRTLNRSTPSPTGSDSPAVLYPAFMSQYMLQNPFEWILKCQEILAVSSARRAGEIPVGRGRGGRPPWDGGVKF